MRNLVALYHSKWDDRLSIRDAFTCVAMSLSDDPAKKLFLNESQDNWGYTVDGHEVRQQKIGEFIPHLHTEGVRVLGIFDLGNEDHRNTLVNYTYEHGRLKEEKLRLSQLAMHG